MTLNNRKDKTGDTIEVAIYGEPGTYVAISAVDRTLYNMQAGTEISYSEVNPLGVPRVANAHSQINLVTSVSHFSLRVTYRLVDCGVILCDPCIFVERICFSMARLCCTTLVTVAVVFR